MSLAALTQPNIAEMVEAAALLCPISYLEHISAPLVLRMVGLHLDQVYFGLYYLHFLAAELDVIMIMLFSSPTDGSGHGHTSTEL